MKFTFYHRYTYRVQSGMISDTGIRLINQLISEQLPNQNWQQWNPGITRQFLPVLPTTWDWRWLVTDGAIVGRFPKRVGKFYYENYGIKCPPHFLEAIGNIARQHTEDESVYYFEFVYRFDWNAGDFGDYGSCYWGSNSGAIDLMEQNDGMAVCFYTEAGDGYARAWFVDVSEFYVLFNGYGFATDSTLTIARVIAGFLNLSYKRIGLSNHHHSNGLLWINNGAGYAIGPEDVIENIRHYDFQWDGGESCANCGEYINSEPFVGADDEYYCENCFYGLFENCSWCGDVYYTEDVYYADGEYLCEYCRNDRCKQCDRCQQWYFPRHMRKVKKHLYCETCYGQVKQE